jgi:hypothetical protein
MGLIFSQLVYVDYFGVGGHGGCGINADRDQRNNEIVAMVSRHINPSSYFLMNIDRLTDNEQNHKPSKKTFLENLKPSQLIRSSQYYNRNNAGFVDDVNGRHYVNSQPNNNNNHQNNDRNRANANANTNGPNRGGNRDYDQNQAGEVPKCAICTLI